MHRLISAAAGRLILTLCLAFLLLELLLRLVPATDSHAVQTVFLPETADGRTLAFYRSEPPPLLWSHNPDHPAVNRMTLIGTELQDEKAAGEFRLLVLGDSVTELGGPEGYAHPAILEDILRDTGVRTLNAGTGGYNTVQAAAWFARYGSPCQADAVILAFVNNDTAPAGERILRSDGVEFRYRQPYAIPLLWDFGTANARVFGLFRSLGLFFRLATPSLEAIGFLSHRPRFDPALAEALAALDRLAESCRRQKIPLLVLHLPAWPNTAFAGLHRNLALHCRQTGLIYHDLAESLSDPDFFDPDERATGQAWHLSRRGHRRVAELLADTLVSLGWVTPPTDRAIPLDAASGPAPTAGDRELRVWHWQGRSMEIFVDPVRDLVPEGGLRGGELPHSVEFPLAQGSLILAAGRIELWHSGSLKSAQLAGNSWAGLPGGSAIDLDPDGNILCGRTGNEVYVRRGGKLVPLKPWTGPAPAGLDARDLLGQWPEMGSGEVELAAWLDRIELSGRVLQFAEPALTWLRIDDRGRIISLRRPHASQGRFGRQEVDVRDGWKP